MFRWQVSPHISPTFCCDRRCTEAHLCESKPSQSGSLPSVVFSPLDARRTVEYACASRSATATPSDLGSNASVRPGRKQHCARHLCTLLCTLTDLATNPGEYFGPRVSPQLRFMMRSGRDTVSPQRHKGTKVHQGYVSMGLGESLCLCALVVFNLRALNPKRT